MGFSVVHIDEIEGAGPGGAVKFVRRRLGVEAFGLNWFEIAPNMEGVEHDEESTAQEEVSVIIRGSGVYRIDGEEVAFTAGSVFRFDPEARRQVVGGPEGCTMVAIGARRGSYEPRGNF
jgi:quercetin dioxygenase-like cupin family protein